MKYFFAFTFVALFTGGTLYAQNVGIGTTSPHPSSELEVSSTTRGFLAPRMTQAQRDAIASPATGLLIYQTDGTAGVYVYDGSAWNTVSNAGGFFKADINKISFNDTSHFGKDLLINTNTVNYLGSGNQYKMMFLPSKDGAFRVGRVSNKNWNIDSIGLSSFASGWSVRATGDYATAMGQGTNARAAYSVAMGYQSTASGQYATAIGYQSTASGGAGSFAIGYQAIASGGNSVAMGYKSKAQGSASFAMGNTSTAEGNYSIAMGYVPFARGAYSAAIGNNTITFGNSSIAMGASTKTYGDYSTAMGNYSIAIGEASFAIGSGDSAIGDYSVAMGQNTIASGSSSVSIGQDAIASGIGSVSIGRNTVSSGINSTAMGYLTKATNNFATAMGNNTTASGYISTAMGSNSTAGGTGSTTIGSNIALSGTATGSMYLADGGRTNTSVATEANPATFYARFNNGYCFYTDKDNLNNGVAIGHLGNSWLTISDSTKKENFRKSPDFLNKIAQMKIGSWNYKGQDKANYRHYGPYAQEFYYHFGEDGIGTVGNDTTIASADIDGVMMIAIQQLIAENEKLKKDNTILKAELNAQKTTTDARLSKLEALLNEKHYVQK